ncbi:hypothetical protein E2C01_021291 [Portunus trituberculatus]|uniref:Uncharacterized protein n=1 Tax=Portunus trituberculatus TaxID=210409 RepID=A0A5B7E4J7_PORTR|nr:hypothetical protein [Portunus trituberculatus]
MNMETCHGTQRVNNTIKCFALSPRQFSKATEMIGGVFKSISPVNNEDILSFCL